MQHNNLKKEGSLNKTVSDLLSFLLLYHNKKATNTITRGLKAAFIQMPRTFTLEKPARWASSTPDATVVSFLTLVCAETDGGFFLLDWLP